ncbi:putative elongator complex protein 1 [Microbotryomycetes sp. JL201]|nr:putative elongator complex protein 1 [Microbotryomycetes sp. JL201]
MKSLVVLGAETTSICPRQDALVPPQHDSQQILRAITSDPASRDQFAIVETLDREHARTRLEIVRLASDTSTAPASIIQWQTESAQANAVIAFKYLSELEALSVVLGNGELEQVHNLEPGQQPARDNVGVFEGGIKAAQWSPDEELLAIVTGHDSLVVMTKDYEVLAENSLHSSTFGADAPVSVGWGSKSSQFHGKAGKAAARDDTVPSAEELVLSHDDDMQPRLSWRGDSAFFVVSLVETILSENKKRQSRRLRVFTRLGELSSTTVPTARLGHLLGWQPSGSIIAASQDSVSAEGAFSQQIIFFERNGLRRYEFRLKHSSARVRDLKWNASSSLLAVWLEHESGDTVQVWTRSNYEWTLKQELAASAFSSSRLAFVQWDPERDMDVCLGTEDAVVKFTLQWTVFRSRRPPPTDDGAVLFLDGPELRLTPFRLLNVPPPMCATLARATRPNWTPVHVSFDENRPTILVLFADGFLEEWHWPLEVTKKSARQVMEPSCQNTGNLSTEISGKMFAMQCSTRTKGATTQSAVLFTTAFCTNVAIFDEALHVLAVHKIPEAQVLTSLEHGFAIESRDGTVLLIEYENPHDPPSPLFAFPEFCATVESSPLPSSLLVGMTASGRLYAGERLLATDASSLLVTSDFVIFTTFSHRLRFVGIKAEELSDLSARDVLLPQSAQQADTQDDAHRSVERGSQIITVVPSSTTVVLQMPRGNLETISPRPLVLQVINNLLQNLRFKAAFLACRRHRIDLNILHDASPVAFLAHLSSFVEQLADVDHINLFLSQMRSEDVTQTLYKGLIRSRSKHSYPDGKVNAVCDAVRQELERMDAGHYLHSILTAHVCKQPADYEGGLRALSRTNSQNVAKANEAVKYIIFLSDAEKLFNLALGMYDFPLVLMIAQHSQKDPREYLPFLQELRQLESAMQKFRIDDHLQRHASAIGNLAQAGDDYFEAVRTYAREHELHAIALQSYRGDISRYNVLLADYAQALTDAKKWEDAALAYQAASRPQDAIAAYVKANLWQDALRLCLGAGRRSATEIKELACEIAGNLRAKRRYAEAGRVLLEYARDMDAACEVLVAGGEFSEALRIAALYNRADLKESQIKDGLSEAKDRLCEEFREVQDQLQKQAARLDELKSKRDTDASRFYCLDEEVAMDNIEVQADSASDAGTAFTRYTTAASTQATSRNTSNKSSRTAKSRKRASLRKAAGKKGTVFEEMYLLNSIKKTFETRLLELQSD